MAPFFILSCVSSTAHLFNTPAVISEHANIPSSLVPIFHDFYVLVKSLILFITMVTKIVREFVKMTEVKMYFYAHVASKLLV